MSVLQTEFEFTLPMGYVDEAGTLHKNGAMRLATAADEILPAKGSEGAAEPGVFNDSPSCKGGNPSRLPEYDKHKND